MFGLLVVVFTVTSFVAKAFVHNPFVCVGCRNAFFSTRTVVETKISLSNVFPNEYDSSHFEEEQGDNSENSDEEHYMDELRLRILKSNTLGPGMDKRPNDVHVILFSSSSGDQGIHTIELPQGSGYNVVLAFESEIDCEHFADELRQQNFFDPEVGDEICS